MLKSLIARFTPAPPNSAYDHLFTPFAPDGAPASVLHDIYHQYGRAMADEVVPPQHRHFRTLVDGILRTHRGDLDKLEGVTLRRVGSAYVTCFEQAEAYEFQLSLWRDAGVFRDALIVTRELVVTELLRHDADEKARLQHYSRWKMCLAEPLGIQADHRLELMKQMTPDDWHEITLRWNWDWGIAELNWITLQHDCDRATAVYALCAGSAGLVATHQAPIDQTGQREGFIRALAARLEGGYYPVADLGLHLPMRARAAFERELDMARATGVSPWQLPDGLVTHPGRAHKPAYSVSNGQVHWHYEHWLRNIAA